MVIKKEVISFTIDLELKKYWKRVSRKENINLSAMVNKFLKKEKEKRMKKEGIKK